MRCTIIGSARPAAAPDSAAALVSHRVWDWVLVWVLVWVSLSDSQLPWQSQWAAPTREINKCLKHTSR